MQRRNFVTGLFGGIVTGGLLVKATTEDVLAFGKPTPDEKLVIQRPSPRQPGFIKPLPYNSGYLYDAEGNQVAIITKVHYEQENEVLESISGRYAIAARHREIRLECIALAGIQNNKRRTV